MENLRIVQIHENANPDIWHHVIPEDNPTGVPSRGIITTDLLNHSLWWHGPKWLLEPENHWPTSKINYDTNVEASNPIIANSISVTLGNLGEDFSILDRPAIYR